MASVSIMRDEEFTEQEIRDIGASLAEIDHCDSGSIGYSDENLIEWNGDMRWNIQTEHLQELAKEYTADIRAVGREDGCAFVQVVCVEAGGKVIQDESIGYAL